MLGIRNWILVFIIVEIADNMKRKMVSWFVNMLVVRLERDEMAVELVLCGSWLQDVFKKKNGIIVGRVVRLGWVV